MDTRIFALVAFIAVLGFFTEARSARIGYPYGNGGLRVDRPSTSFAAMSRLKREIDDSNGESTTKPTTTQATTTTSTSTEPSTTPSSTTPSSTTTSSTTPPTSPTTTPPTSPTTTPSTTPTTTPTTPTTPTTTEATSPMTTPTSTSASTPTSTSATTPTTLSTTPSTTTPSTTTPSTTTPESTEPTKKPNIQSRSNADEPEPEDSPKKPEPSPKVDKAPTPGPYFGAPGFGFGGPSYDPYYGYPGFNSIPPTFGPNYAWTGTNNGPGYASAGASAGSFGYPGMGYPMAGSPPFPTAGSPPFPTAGPSPFSSRGGFQDNPPNQDNSPNKDYSPNQSGYNFGGDPLYNAGPGFFYPGQFPTFNDPSFDMFKQIQAQFEAQHQANMELHNRLANEAANYGNYGGGNYGDGVPQVSSASIGLGPYGGFQSGQISPAAPGIESRFADDLPPPSGNSYGVFASSSSSSRTGPDGRPINHKSSITGVNDNGKVSYRTVHD